MAEPTIASGALRKLVTAAGARGVQEAAILRAARVEQSVAHNPDARIPIVGLHAAWDHVLEVVPNLDVAPDASVGDYGIVGFVVMNSATVAEALTHFVRYSGLWTDEPVFSVEGATVHFRYGHRFDDGPGRRRATEAAPIEIIHGARMATRRHITPREVRLAHPAPRDVSPFTGFFGCPVRFGARDDVLELRQEDLALPLAGADAQLGAFLRGLANDALARRGAAPDSPIDDVKRILAEELQRGVPSSDRVAARLATSERTLRRRLERGGTSFRALLDDTRAELARVYVRDRRMPLTEVAFMLGFSEPSAFHRAFKRWTRTTPAAWRAREE